MPSPSVPEQRDKRDGREHAFGEALAGRLVLVTGADGFIGSHLTEALIHLGCDVHAFVRATSSGALHNLADVRSQLTVHHGDLADHHAVAAAIGAVAGASRPPYVFHLAAQAHVGESWHRPYETLDANVLGTLNLLQSIVAAGLECQMIDVAGSSEEYGNVDPARRTQYRFDGASHVTLDERSPINPTSIYATSKVATDFLARNFHDAYGLPTVVTRMFNNYGPRQNPRYITGTIITQALTRDRVELGNLEPTRDFCYCSDGVRGHLAAAVHGTPGSVYCYGSGEAVSIGDWARLILAIGEEEGHWTGREVVSVPQRLRPGSSDVTALKVGHERLTTESGWKAIVGAKEGLRRTIAWYAEHPERWVGRIDWSPTEATTL